MTRTTAVALSAEEEGHGKATNTPYESTEVKRTSLFFKMVDYVNSLKILDRHTHFVCSHLEPGLQNKCVCIAKQQLMGMSRLSHR